MVKVFTASHFEKQNWHGVPVSISLRDPQNSVVEDSLVFLAPTWEMVKAYKQTRDEQAYIAAYRKLIRDRWSEVKQWLDSLPENKGDITLLCWEKRGEFCHLNLAFELVKHHHPDLAGGQDVSRFDLATEN